MSKHSSQFPKWYLQIVRTLARIHLPQRAVGPRILLGTEGSEDATKLVQPLEAVKISAMKCLSVIFAAAIFGFAQLTLAQGFVNMDFEDATLSPATGTANVSGWTEFNGYADGNYPGGMSIIYNNRTLDEPDVSLSLAGMNSYLPAAIQGGYSVFLWGGDAYDNKNGASIEQTGQIPSTAQSIIYWGDQFQVSFAGHPLPLSAIGSGPNYTIWGADVSAYAGQTGELLFTAPWGGFSGLIDNIEFSSSPIPEPSEPALLALGALSLGFWRWRKSVR